MPYASRNPKARRRLWSTARWHASSAQNSFHLSTSCGVARSTPEGAPEHVSCRLAELAMSCGDKAITVPLIASQFAIGGRSCHCCRPSGSEDSRVHRLSFNFLQTSRATTIVYPLLVLPSLSLVFTSTFADMSTDQSLPRGSTVSTLASNLAVCAECTLSIN